MISRGDFGMLLQGRRYWALWRTPAPWAPTGSMFWYHLCTLYPRKDGNKSEQVTNISFGKMSLEEYLNYMAPTDASKQLNKNDGYCVLWRGWDSDSLRDGRSGNRIPVGSEIFFTHRDRPWGSPSLLYDVYRVSFPVVQRPRLKKV